MNKHYPTIQEYNQAHRHDHDPIDAITLLRRQTIKNQLRKRKDAEKLALETLQAYS